MFFGENIKICSGGMEEKPASFASPLEVGRLLCRFLCLLTMVLDVSRIVDVSMIVAVSMNLVAVFFFVLFVLFCFVTFF